MVMILTSRFMLRACALLGGSKLARLWRRDDGVAAVEFGFVAAPFFAILFAIAETALVFFAGQTLETAAADSARLILTGQAQNHVPPLTQATYKDAVCAKIFGLFDCNKIKVDVKKYSTFAAVDLSKPVDAQGKLKTNFTYDPGGPCQIVVARLMYQFPVLLTRFGFSLADMPDGTRLLIATTVFRNEPYQGSC
jgi:Flp pilus assembly protein TadG